MTPLCFVCLARDAGPHLLDDAARFARADDQIVVIDDSGDPQALTHVRKFVDIPTGVAITPIMLGRQTSLHTAIHIGLQAATAPRAIILNGHRRPLPALHTARDLGGAVIGPTPDLFDMILLTDLPAPNSLHALLWTAVQGATQHVDPLVSGLITSPDSLPVDLNMLAKTEPQSADWITQHRIAWTHAMVPGARHAHGIKQQTLPCPPANFDAKPRIHLAGPHATRCPLHYLALGPLWADHLDFTDDAKTADLVVYTHPQDVATATAISPAPHVLFSEEPFWDTLFSPDPCAAQITLPMAHVGRKTFDQINHHTSNVYDFARIPYYLLTHHRFITAYGKLFARNAALTADDWKTALTTRTPRTVFMAERRPETLHDLRIDAGDITGLCAWRTRLAETTTGPVTRIGSSWQGGKNRFQLDDWHSDKLGQLDGTATRISAVENTHQPTYLSEKLFDAFACGAQPLYYASPQHRVHSLGIPAAAWTNLWGMDSDQAAQALITQSWDTAFFAAYSQAQQTLNMLFNDENVVNTEHKRLQAATLSELQRHL